MGSADKAAQLENKTKENYYSLLSCYRTVGSIVGTGTAPPQVGS